MSVSQDGKAPNGEELARQIAEEESGRFRVLTGPSRYVVPALALAWCGFQLSIASWLIVDTTYIRSIHLAFAMAITFLSYPVFRRHSPQGMLSWLSARHRIPLLDWVLAILGALSALYIIIDYEGISYRLGTPLTRDIVIGMVLLVVLLEASRRVIGPALSLIAILFVFYSFMGPYMPDVIAFKGTSLGRFVGQITMSTEGIYGIPLDVSARIVFYFVLFGSMLEQVGAGQYFIRLAISLLGGFKGGPAKAAVVSSMLTGMVSGSSIANVVTTGTFTIPLMKKVGYPPKKAAAIEVAASIDGQLAPPVMGAAAFIIAEYINVPYIEVVKAAAVPAFASYFALLFIVHIEASKLGLRGLPREELPKFFPTLASGFHYLIPLGVLIYELIVPRHSPELAAFRAILVMTGVILIREILRCREGREPYFNALKNTMVLVVNSMVAGGRNMVAVAIATATAGVIVGIVTLGLGGLITEIIQTISMNNIFIMLVVATLASMVLGMGLPTTATYIVMASLTAPAIVEIGAANGFIVPIMAAHLFCFYFGMLADDTPPVGLASYAASAIAGSEPIPTGIQGFKYHIRTAILPFMFIFNHELILHGVDSVLQGLLIFSMACIGCFSFASATQGWFTAKNKWYEVPLLLVACFILLRPIYTSQLMGLPHSMRYIAYLVGLAIWVGVFLLQRRRRMSAGVEAKAGPYLAVDEE